tara:strand:- start:1604 stop:1753 length:150 start_codon:yes stop_codon:yes gene_type:complete
MTKKRESSLIGIVAIAFGVSMRSVLEGIHWTIPSFVIGVGIFLLFKKED